MSLKIIPIYLKGNKANPIIGYRIHEKVSKDGLYIEWDGLFQSETSAVSHIEKTIKTTVFKIATDTVHR